MFGCFAPRPRNRPGARASEMAFAVLCFAAAASTPAATSAVVLNNQERLLAGGSARFGAQLVMYPADALRTLAQTRAGAKTLAELGPRTLISGCATTSMFAFGVGGLQFSIFGALNPKIGALFASACASLTPNSSIACPSSRVANTAAACAASA